MRSRRTYSELATISLIEIEPLRAEPSPIVGVREWLPPGTLRATAIAMAVVAVAGLACLLGGGGTAAFLVVMTAKGLALGVARRRVFTDDLASMAELTTLASALTFAASLAVPETWGLVSPVVMLDWAGSMAILAVYGRLGERAAIAPARPGTPIDPTAWGLVRDRVVLVSGSALPVVADLTERCREAGAKRVVVLVDRSEASAFESACDHFEVVMALGDAEDAEFVREVFATYRPSLVFLADGPSPAHPDGSMAIAARRLVNEALRTGAEAFLRIAPEWERADGRMADRVVRALASLAPTRLIRVRYAEWAEPASVGRAALRAAACGRDGVFRALGHGGGLRYQFREEPKATARSIWAVLDRLEAAGHPG